MSWVMFDIETLGVRTKSVIVSLGACRFDEKNEPVDKMALLLHMGEQVARGRTFDLNTITWWMQQDDKAREWNFNTSNRYPVDVALRAFATFCQGATAFWSRGSFDPILLESLHEDFGQKVPWRFHELRDERSLDELAPKPTMVGVVAHKPLDDCIAQVAHVRAAFKQRLNLNIRTPSIDGFKPGEDSDGEG